MEMKAKKNKMFLAMAVVAALAMVSVAGVVTISDDSDADTTSMFIGTTIEITEDKSALELNLVVDIWNISGMNIGLGIGNVHVLPGVSVTGTINVGYKDASGKFVITDSLKLTNAGGFNATVIVISAEGDLASLAGLLGISIPSFVLDNQISFIGIGNDDATTAPTGSFELTKGEAILGSISTPGVIQVLLDEFVNGGTVDFVGELLATVTPFTGNMKVKGLELEATDVAGTIISAEGNTAIMTGGAASLPGYDAKLTIKGTAVVDWPTEIKDVMTMISLGTIPQVFISYDAAVTIAADADITIGSVEPLAVEEFCIEAGDLVDFGYLYSASGKVFVGDAIGYNLYFDGVPVGTYTLIMGTDVGDLFYSTNVTVSGSMGKYNVSLGSNRITPGSAGEMDILDLVFDYTNGWIEYPATFVPQIGINLATGEKGVVTDDGLTFSAMTSGDFFVFIAADRSVAGTPILAFFGDDTASYYNDALIVKNTLASGEIYISSVESQDSIGIYMMMGNSTLKVEGTLKFLYTSDTPAIYGMMDNSYGGRISFAGNGVIEYGVTPATVPIVPYMGLIDAAYYYKNVTDSGVVIKSTYYFTTIEKALEDSDGADIVIVGTIVIEKDTDWQVDQNTKIILGDSTQSGRIEVGIYDPTDDTKTRSPALNIDEQIEIIISNGSYEVISGQIIFNTNTFPTFPPTAHVRIVRDSENKIIYADVATGFNIVRTGETLELITDAELRYDATLIAGATFDDKGYTMTIPAGKTLTVNGIYKSTSPGKLITERNSTGGIGTLVINNGAATFPVGTTIENNGSIKVNTAGTFTLDGTMNGFGTGVLVIDGTFYANGAVNAISELELKGTLKIGTAGFTVMDLIIVGAEPILLSALQNNASITGTITIGSAAVVLVYGNSSVTKANFTYPTGIGETKFVYQNLSTVYATQYGALPGVPGTLKYLTCDSLKDFTLVGWYESAGLTPATEVTPSRFATVEFPGNIAVLYGYFVPKTFTVTLSDYSEGINWVVNGKNHGMSDVITFNYNDPVKVSVRVLNGFTGTPVILKDGGAYSANTEFKVTENTVFTVSGVKVADPPKDDGGLTLIEILLIIIVIIIAIISIIVALRLLRS
jgi:hypothetical protein